MDTLTSTFHAYLFGSFSTPYISQIMSLSHTSPSAARLQSDMIGAREEARNWSSSSFTSSEASLEEEREEDEEQERTARENAEKRKSAELAFRELRRREMEEVKGSRKRGREETE